GEAIAFFTMELLHGDTLAGRIRRHGPFPAAEARPLIEQMAAGLGAAHAVGIVHGDFKPANVMLVPPAEGSRAGARLVVTDFSLAHPEQMGATSAPTMTASPGWGTPAYMSPEQVAGGPLTPRTDVYALGAVVHEMITGCLPFGSSKPPRGTLLPRWRSAIDTCLERDPEARFATTDAFIRALDAPVAGGSLRRRLKVALFAGAALLVVTALALLAVWQSQRLRTAIAGRSPRLAGVLTPARRSVAFLPLAYSDVAPGSSPAVPTSVSGSGGTAEDAQAFGEGLAIVLTEQVRLASGLAHVDDRLWVLPAAEVIDVGPRTPAGAARRLG